MVTCITFVPLYQQISRDEWTNKQNMKVIILICGYGSLTVANILILSVNIYFCKDTILLLG